MKSKKTIGIIIVACVVVGIVYAISSMLPENQTQIVLIGVAVTILIIWMGIKIANMFRLNKIVSAPTYLLYEEKRPDLYVQEMQQIVEKMSSRQQKDLIRINIAAGYLYNGQLEKVEEQIQQIALPGQPEANQVLCYAYEAMAYFLKGEREKGLEVIESQRSLLKKYDSTASGLTNNVLVLYGFEKIAKGEYKEALETLDLLKEKKVSSILQDIVDYLYLECYRNLKMDAERHALRDMMRKASVVPVIKNKIA